MVRRSGVDDVLPPHEFETLFQKAATIKDPARAVEMSGLLVFAGRLGGRNAEVLHTCDDYVIRNYKGEIVDYQIPTGLECSDDCPVCRMLAKQAARDADADDAHWTDFIDQYWSPKSHAGGRKIPVLTERQSEMIDLYLEYYGGYEAPMTEQTYRNRLLRLEEVCDAVDVNLYPQSLRATAVNNLILRGMNPVMITNFIGWKYLSTAIYYVTKSDHRLRMALQEAYNRDVTIPYHLPDEPRTFSEIRANNDLWELDQLTPERYRASDDDIDGNEDPLETHAQKSIENTTLSDFLDSAENQSQIGPAVLTAGTEAIDHLEERGRSVWDRVVGLPLLDQLGKTRRRLLPSGMVLLTLMFVTALVIASTTNAVDLAAGSVELTQPAAAALLLAGYQLFQSSDSVLGDRLAQLDGETDA
ncbi:hypothetical protein [Halorientalis regularis]|uniref:Phage integrase family protein n=1 Tax=Halorientalis regularis TaxID=660518 RepID=A0A1G7QHN1_9EURY|nr:hypothetical protein [Halorientalis regularis]SDF97130.1 hypothetical protein SAMN05216218_112119 [Halorientalis regularis]